MVVLNSIYAIMNYGNETRHTNDSDPDLRKQRLQVYVL